MGKSAQYTDDEWAIVSSTPQLVGVAMAGVGSSGLLGSAKEMFANAKSMMKARSTHADNPLILAILPDTTDSQQAMSDAQAQREIIMARLEEKNVKSSEQMTTLILEDCSKAMAILEDKEPSDVITGYKQWLLEVAENVANAAKEGDFLGFGGERFSEKEKEFFTKLKAILS